MKATLYLPAQEPQGAPVRGLQCEWCDVTLGALCAAAVLLSVELPDVRTICIDPEAGIIAYVGNELQPLADQRNLPAEQALNHLLPGTPFFGGAGGHYPGATSWYGPVLLVERRERAEAGIQAEHG